MWNDKFREFLLGGIAGAVGSDRRDGGFGVDVLLVSIGGVIVQGFDDLVRVDLERS